MKRDVVVVVPVYRDFVPSEAYSFAQCLKVLGKYDISLLHPASHDVTDVIRSTPQNVTEKAMDDRWFKGILGYNRLCLSTDFYDAYSDYEYMLIYQLDAFVFRDELADWCAREYDYIGAPWLPNSNLFESTVGNLNRWVRRQLRPAGSVGHISHYDKHYRVGNGGFSLRRVSKLQSVVATYGSLIDGMGDDGRRSKEDVFFSLYIAGRAGLRIPGWREGLRFAFDSNPEKAFRVTGGRLPFGCHYWSHGRSWQQFWHRYIPFDPHQDGEAFRD